MWFIGVEVEQETSAPLLKKILDPPLLLIMQPRICYELCAIKVSSCKIG